MRVGPARYLTRMRNARTMGGLVGSALLMSACGGGGSVTGGGPSEATARTQSEALTAAPAAVMNYRHVKGVRLVSNEGDAAPTDATCRALYGSPCYSPQEMQTGYGVSALLADGYDGAGQTIVIVDSYGSPTIAADLAQFDADYGLPDPPCSR